jgi:hypothetical protein
VAGQLARGALVYDPLVECDVAGETHACLSADLLDEVQLLLDLLFDRAAGGSVAWTVGARRSCWTEWFFKSRRRPSSTNISRLPFETTSLLAFPKDVIPRHRISSISWISNRRILIGHHISSKQGSNSKKDRLRDHLTFETVNQW